MCSGCSGSYEGDEGPDCAMPELQERTDAGDVVGVTRSLWAVPRGRSTAHERGRNHATHYRRGLEAYEVLVSSARIVEVRTIPAIPFSSCSMSTAEADDGCTDRRCDIKRSSNESAKYYQTGTKVGKYAKHSPHVDRKQLLLHWGLALLALIAATLWLGFR
jgi:hypothetical protein